LLASHEMVSAPYSRTRAVPPGLKWRCEITELQRLIRVFARTPEDSNSALLLERVGSGRKPHLPCPSRWICAPRRITATTSQNEAVRKLLVTVRPSDGAGQERERQGSGRSERMRTMRDETTSCPRRRRFARRVGRGYTRDVVIAPVIQITLFACDAALCAAKKPDEFTV